MEKLKQLPLGYRFMPTDFELIVEYLIKKLKNQQLSCNAVVEHDIYSTEPWNLKGNKDDIGGAIDKGYYFVNREKKTAASKKKPSRSVNPGDGSRGGFWKATGGDIEIRDERYNLVGVKKSLKYFRFASDKRMTNDAEKTGWIMHEYTLPRNNEFQPWVVCSIRFNGNDVEYKKQHQKLKQEAPNEPVILQQEHDNIQEVIEQYDQQGKQQLLLPRFKVIDNNEEDMNIMQDYAKAGGQGGELPRTQTCEASSSAMSGAAACSSSASYHQDVPPVPAAQDQLTNDNNSNNAHDYCGFQEREGLDSLMWTADDGYSYSYGCHSGTAAINYGY